MLAKLLRASNLKCLPKILKSDMKNISATVSLSALYSGSIGLWISALENTSLKLPLFNAVFGGMSAIGIHSIRAINAALNTKPDTLEMLLNESTNFYKTRKLTKNMPINDAIATTRFLNNNPFFPELDTKINKIKSFDSSDAFRRACEIFMYEQYVSFELDNLEKILLKLEGVKDQEIRDLVIANSKSYFHLSLFDFKNLESIADTDKKYFLMRQLSETGRISNPKIFEFHSKLKHLYHKAIDKSWNEYSIDNINYLAEFDDPEFLQAFGKLIEKNFGYSEFAALRYSKLNSENKKRVALNLIRNGSKLGFARSIDLLSRADENSELINLIASKGKKKQRTIIHMLANLPCSCNLQIGEELAKKYQNDLSEENLRSFFNEKIKEYFSIDELSSNFTSSDMAYFISAIEKNHDEEDSVKDLIGSVISGVSISDFRSNHETYWGNGIETIVQTTQNIKFDLATYINENLNEAREHLLEAGYNLDGLENPEDILELISKDSGNLVEDARGHLINIIDAKKKDDQTFHTFSYRSGTLEDFVYIGERPKNTCLSLNGCNSTYTLSMASNPAVFCYYVEGIKNEKRIPLTRAILRRVKNSVVVDDIYGETIDFLSPLQDYAKSLGCDLKLMEPMKNRISDNDKKLLGKKVEIEEEISSKIYSDSLSGRVDPGNVKYSVFSVKAA